MAASTPEMQTIENVILTDGSSQKYCVVVPGTVADMIKNDASFAASYLEAIKIQTSQQNQAGETAEQSPATAMQDTDSCVISTWTRPMVLLLIKCYRDRKNAFRDPRKKKKLLWIDISRVMKENAYNFSWDACDKKWRNLKKTYKNVISQSRKNGESVQSWKYFRLMQEILGESDEIEAPRQLPSSATHSPSSTNDEKQAASDECGEYSVSQRALNDENPKRLRTEQKGLHKWLEKFVTNYSTLEDHKLQEMREFRGVMRELVQVQKERNDVLNRFTIAMEKLVESRVVV